MSDEALQSPGQSLDRESRAYTEPRSGQDFSHVQVHAGARVMTAPRGLGDSYEQEADWAARRVVPALGTAAEPAGQGAIELSHVALQIQCAETDDRASETSAAVAPSGGPAAQETRNAAGLIVEDNAAGVHHGEMRKGRFLDELEAAVCAEADAELAAAGRSTEGCPYIRKWLGHYRASSAAHTDRALRKFVPEAARVTAARDYIPLVSARVRRAVAVWADTGQITDVPEELKSQLAGGGPAEAISGVVSGIGSALGGIFAKAREGNAKTAGDPVAIQAQLGPGHSLNGGIKSRVESAFGYDFSSVRVHTDARAARALRRLQCSGLHDWERHSLRRGRISTWNSNR